MKTLVFILTIIKSFFRTSGVGLSSLEDLFKITRIAFPTLLRSVGNTIPRYFEKPLAGRKQAQNALGTKLLFVFIFLYVV